MDAPQPNPEDGGPGPAPTPAPAARPAPPPSPGALRDRDRRAKPQKARRDLVAPRTGAARRHPHTHPRPRRQPPPPERRGPAGIKQCFRAVKAARRIHHQPTKPPTDVPSTSARPPPPQPPPTPTQQPSEPRTSKKHGCKTCGKKFNSPGKLSQHELSHTGELPFDCQFCDKRFNSKFKLVRHRLIHNETRPFACRHCDKTFHRKDHLSNHERIHDPVKKFYMCEKESCKKRYTSYISFRKHAAMHSAEEGNLECKICSKVFENRDDIVYHLRVHAGSRTVKNETDKKFPCSQCERKFFTAKDVRRHLVVHTGRRDFLCQHCPQKFGRKDHLVRHVKKAHPDERWQTTAPGTSSSSLPARSGTDVDSLDADAKSDASIGDALSDVKPEPSLEVVEMDKGAYGLAAPEDVAAIITLPSADPGPSTSELHKYAPEAFPGGIIYIMPSNPTYPLMSSPPELMMDENIESYMEGEGLVPVLDSDRETLELLERPPDEPLLMEEDDDVTLRLPMLHRRPRDPNVPSATVALPTFNQAFQNAAQSPKPPHPPK